MKTLFDTTEFAGLKLKNRFVRSATYDGVSDAEGHVTQRLLDIYENLAKGGVGAIITGLTTVTDAEKLPPAQMGIYNDSFIDEYKELTALVHKYDTIIFNQLACNGAQNNSKKDGVLWGPSFAEDPVYKTVAREMTKDDISIMKEAFASGALRAKKAGFDGVQLHAAHGYLLSRFLTPHYNRRTDEYGGSIENRARIILETYFRIREYVGDDFPVLVKINCADFIDNGMTFDESRHVCRMLADAGVSALEVSGGVSSSNPGDKAIRKISSEDESYFARYAAQIASEINIPVFSVGGHRDFEKLTGLLRETNIEYFSMCRPFIREPDIINRWQGGDLAPAKCISCCKCFHNDGTRCVFNKSAE